MSKFREGSLEAPTRHPIPWKEADFYDEDALNQELERVFDICHGCRRCVSLCKSFPTLFDLIDESKTLEVDGVAKSDYKKVVDECYLCDLCYMTKCPYVPPHEWNVDFPHLMLRAKAVQFKQGKVTSAHKLLTAPQTVGKLASKPVINQVVNWGNQNQITRKITEKVLGVHSEAVIPHYHTQTLSKRFKEAEVQSEHKVAIFGTCYGEYNDPSSVMDLVDVLRHNKVEVQLVKKTGCCGMPKMELGDLESVVEYANQNLAYLEEWVNQGYKLIAAIPSCVLMFKNELPMILSDNEAIKKIADAFYDPFEYLSFLEKNNQLNKDFQPINKSILYQMACHQRVQNIGSHTKKILQMIPDLEVDVAQRCSGHDGTYGVRKETYVNAVEIGKPIVNKMKSNTDLIISDCVMAGNHIAHIANQTEGSSKPSQKMVSIHPISLVKLAYGI